MDELTCRLWAEKDWSWCEVQSAAGIEDGGSVSKSGKISGMKPTQTYGHLREVEVVIVL